MKPRYHLIYGFILSIAITYLLDLSLFTGTIIFLASILIDIDHYTRYIIREKDISPSRFLTWSDEEGNRWREIPKEKRNEHQYPSFIFHGVEMLLLLYIIGFYYLMAWWILTGFLIHIFLDYITIIRHGEPFWFKLSQIWVFTRNKRNGF